VWGKRYGGCCVSGPLCVFGCSSAVVVECACVKDCRGLGVCMVGTVSYSAGGKCAGGRVNMMTG
jgi:hypothetical protein